MQTDQVLDLLRRYTSGNCTEEEKALVESTYLKWIPGYPELSGEEIGADLQWIAAHLPKDKTQNKLPLYKKIAAAAAVFLIVFGCMFFLKTLHKPSLLVKKNTAQEEIVPGTDRAILTLANGRKIVLDKSAATLISDTLSGIRIKRTEKGEVIYETVNNNHLSAEQQSAYHTIETPRGSQYKIILPDGTNVWLNAASSLRYPVVFSGAKRSVELAGEGYFEVTKNKKMPFVVTSGSQKIEVLGTHFNVNAYADESSIKTTLLEGSVKLTNKQNQVTLVPGQQAVLLYQQDNFSIHAVNTDDAVGWKNGIFSFVNNDIEYIMKQVSRWYNVEIEYRGDLSKARFGGTVSKFENVSELLKTMELTGSVHFKIEGRRIIVMP